MSANCAFCNPGLAELALWESEHYRIVADKFPRCTGHVLLVTKDHYASHMHAPESWMPEFETAQERMRGFLVASFGKAAFFENGAARQEVPHAHLHGLPYAASAPKEFLENGFLRPISSWHDARRERERAGYYFYLEGAPGRYLLADHAYRAVLLNLKDQMLSQADAQTDPATGHLIRGGPEMIEETVRMWRTWSSR
jgi:diadenosine tetraphosphate (Ap4A) HIT family hydrolase